MWLLLATLTLTNAVPFSIKFGGQAWGMAKSVDHGATWTPIATVDMHTYQQVGMVGEVRGDAQEGMMIKFQPLHTILARELGYQCPKMHEKCDGTCTFDASRNSQCFNWDHARIFIHELNIDGQKQDFSSLNTMQSSGWNFQCRSLDSSCQPPMRVIDFGDGYKMVRQDGADFYYTYTFTGIENTATFALGADWSGNCPVGSVPIRTQDECETAARFFSLGDTSASRWRYPHSSIPSGCWYYLNVLYFNNDPNQWNFSGNNGYVKVLCKSEAIAETTVNPTLSPTKGPSVNPTGSPTANPSLSPTKAPSVNPTRSPTANPSNYPTSEGFIIRVKGFHGQPKSILDANKLGSEGQSNVDVELYGFDRKLMPVGRRLLKKN